MRGMKTVLSVFIGAGMALFAPQSIAKQEIADNLSIFGDVRYRIEHDADDYKERDRSRERVRLRLGGLYDASDRVELGFRLATGTASVQSPHTTLELSNCQKNTGFGLDRAYIKMNASLVVVTLGKFGSPLMNTEEFLHDDDIQLEGISLGFISQGGLNISAQVEHILLAERGWTGWDDDYMTMAQLVLSTGGDVAVKLGAGGVLFNKQTADPLSSHSWYHALAEISVKNLSNLSFGGGYQAYSGDYEYDSADKSALMAYVKVKLDDYGLRLYYWDVGVAGALDNGSLAQDNFPFSSNFTGIHAQVDMPKLLDAVSWDLRYYSQTAKNEDLVFDSENGAPGYIQTKGARTRVQLNFNAKF